MSKRLLAGIEGYNEEDFYLHLVRKYVSGGRKRNCKVTALANQTDTRLLRLEGNQAIQGIKDKETSN